MSNTAIETPAAVLSAARDRLTALRFTLERDRTALRADPAGRYADGEAIYATLLDAVGRVLQNVSRD